MKKEKNKKGNRKKSTIILVCSNETIFKIGEVFYNS